MFHGESMKPFLEDGDEIIVMSVKWKEINVGDIVTYRLDDKFPTYRVVSKMEDKLILKPDNWMIAYEIPREDVLGKVVERRRGGSSLSCADWLWILFSQRVLLGERKRHIISKIRYNFSKIKEISKRVRI